MRLEELRLLAFGPFTNERLDLGGGAPGGLHVIYGPNEAGKSTSLRAVKNLLFGIPRRSVDAHLHPSPRLALGAILSDGDELFEVSRLKRNKDDLVGPDGQPLAVDPIPRLLGHLDETSFSLRFGLDQVELEKGAEALLGGSEQGLFAAGTAGSDVRRVLSELDQEATSLFLSRGKLPVLNRQNTEYEQALLEVRRAERPVEKWISQKNAHQAAVERVAQIGKERAETRAELRRLNRLKAVMSDLLEWQEAEARLEQLAEVKELPADTFERRLEIAARLTEFQAEARRVSEDLKAFEADWEAFPEDSPLCDIDDAQLELGARIGTAISARKDLPKRRAALLEQERQMAILLRELGKNVPPGLELATGREALAGAEVSGTVRRLVSQYSGLENALGAVETRLRQIEPQIADLRAEADEGRALSELPHLEALLAQSQAMHLSLLEARQEEKQLSALRVRARRLRAELRCETPWQKLAEGLPSQEFFEQCVRSLQEQKQSLSAALKEKALLEAELGEKIEVSRGDATLPSEGALRDARSERDDLLQRVRGGGGSWEEFEGAVLGCDRLADDLLAQADRVYRARALAQKIEELRLRLQDSNQAISALESKLEQGRTDMAELAGRLGALAPRRVEEIPGFEQRLRSLVEVEEDCAVREAQLAPVQHRVQELVARLRSELGESDEGLDLSGLHSMLEQEVKRTLQFQERSVQRQKRLQLLEQEKKETLEELERARQKMDRWKEAWAQALLHLGLTQDCSVERAQEVLSTLQRMERVLEVAANYESRIAGMQRDTQALDRDISRYVKEYLDDGAPAEDVVDKAVRLQEAIRAARHHRQERRRIRSLIEERRATLSSVQAKRKAAEEQINALLRLAAVEDESQLAEAEQRSNEKRRLVERRQELLERIRIASDGAPITELALEAEQWGGAVRRLIARIDELDERSSELEDELRQAEAEAEGMRLGLISYQSEDVAVSRQILSERAAAARASLRRYLVVRAAHALLDEQVSRYAERFSGPIAGRAGELFSRITLGKYSRLSIGLGENSLRCVRDGHEVDISELSRGTRAQLYFVLRLASLERYFDEHPAVPLVFDDLFVDFDDDRTTVAFELLSDLAKKVQILYFTHLARDVEKAHDAVPQQRLFTHTIGVY